MQLSSLLSSYGAGSVYSTTSTASTTSTSTVDDSITSSSANTDTVSFSISSSSVVSSHQASGESLMDMSTDDFREHLKELVAEMEANGVDTSSFADIDSLTDSELESLKSDMHDSAVGKGKNGPPPPPPAGYEMAMSFSTEDDEVDSLTQILLDALEKSQEDEVESYYSLSQSLLEALTQDETLDETGDLVDFMAANL